MRKVTGQPRSANRLLLYVPSEVVALLERVGDQCEDLLVLVEEQAGGEMSQALVGEPRRG